MANQGKFIVIEGLEGAGKSTAIEVVQQLLQEKNIAYESVREPGGTVIAEQVRTILKANQEEVLNDKAELLLMYCARIQLIQEIIKPALSKGIWVIADRFEWSTIAYQGWGRGIDKSIIEFISKFAVCDVRVDKTIYLDIDPAIGLERALARGAKDRIEQEQLSFFNKVQQGYQWLTQHDPNCVVIDAQLPLAKVHTKLQNIVNLLLL